MNEPTLGPAYKGPAAPQGIAPSEIRSWAIVNGFPDLDGKNGRLPQRAIDAYIAAHSDDETVPES